jgi:flagellar hook-length control protein FliK
MAAAIAQGTSAPTTQSSPPADDLATPDTGAAPQGLLGSSAAQTQAIAAAATPSPATLTAAVRAATALLIAQAVSASAGAGAADKHARGDSDSSVSASNDSAAGAAQLLTSSTATDVSPPPTLKVAAGVDTAEFGQGVADRVSLMMDSNLTSAKLQVNPPALGPIEVRIALQGGHAQVWFTSHSAVTRDALESSSPQLREMLGAQGFGQVSVDISQRSFQERPPQSHGYEGTPAINGDSSAAVQTPSATSRAASGLLDAYA